MTTQAPTLSDLETRIAALEARVAALEARPASSGRASAPARAHTTGGGASRPSWATTYEVAQLELQETWIEMHEPSARRQLQRMIRDCVAVEGPVTEGLALRRVREAWGLKRAGARIQEVFEQNVKQLVHNEYLERFGDAVVLPKADRAVVRVPGADDATKRGADEIGERELALAMRLVSVDAGSIDADDLTAAVARLFGWTRRGTEIQARLDHVMERAIARGELMRQGARIAPGE